MFLLGLFQRTVNVKLTDTWNICFALQVQSCNLSLNRKIFLSVTSQSVSLMKLWRNPFHFLSLDRKKNTDLWCLPPSIWLAKARRLPEVQRDELWATEQNQCAFTRVAVIYAACGVLILTLRRPRALCLGMSTKPSHAKKKSSVCPCPRECGFSWQGPAWRMSRLSGDCPRREMIDDDWRHAASSESDFDQSPRLQLGCSHFAEFERTKTTLTQQQGDTAAPHLLLPKRRHPCSVQGFSPKRQSHPPNTVSQHTHAFFCCLGL